MIETFKKGLSEAKFKRIENEVRQEVIKQYGESNLIIAKLVEIALNVRLAKLAAIPSFENWNKSSKVGVLKN